jgi:hypothetical protein
LKPNGQPERGEEGHTPYLHLPLARLPNMVIGEEDQVEGEAMDIHTGGSWLLTSAWEDVQTGDSITAFSILKLSSGPRALVSTKWPNQPPLWLQVLQY